MSGAGEVWHPGFGDPTALGWTVTFAYLAVAGLSFRAARATTRRSARRGAAHGMVGVALLLLGINKQLDLQTLLVPSQGTGEDGEGSWREALAWWAPRGLSALVGALGLHALWSRIRSDRPAAWSSLGLLLVVGYALVRAHQILRDSPGGLAAWWPESFPLAALELAGIAAVARGAWTGHRASGVPLGNPGS